LAWGFSAAAVFSKETIVFLLPILALFPWLLERNRSRMRDDAMVYASLALAWAALHPKLHSLLTHGLATGSGGYVGLDNPAIGGNLVQLASTALNVPGGTAEAWSPWITWIAMAATFGGAWWIWQSAGGSRSGRYPTRRALLFGVLLAVLPGVATAAWVKHWSPYYACIPEMGFSITIALILSRMDVRIAMAMMALFLAMGLWSRASASEDHFPRFERDWGAVSKNLEKIRTGMMRLRPTLPPGAQVYVSIHLPYNQWIHAHLLNYQAPRVWYGRPTLEVLPAGRFDPRLPNTVLFWISPSCDVFEMTYPSLEVRASGPRPSYDDYQRARRLVAVGLFRAGAIDEAARAVSGMAEPDLATAAFDRRLAAAFYFASGRVREARNLLCGLNPAERGEALQSLAVLVGPLGSMECFVPAAFQAFGVSRSDADAWRYLMRWYLSRSESEPACRMARQLLALRPRDEAALRVIEWISSTPHDEQVTVARPWAIAQGPPQ
jgi:hypothetical protein